MTNNLDQSYWLKLLTLLATKWKTKLSHLMQALKSSTMDKNDSTMITNKFIFTFNLKKLIYFVQTPKIGQGANFSCYPILLRYRSRRPRFLGLLPYKFLSVILILTGPNLEKITREIVTQWQIGICDQTVSWIKKLQKTDPL